MRLSTAIGTIAPSAMLLTLLACPASAVTVHTWVDENGVRHFSDTPPAGVTVTEQFELDEPAADAPAPEADYYSITNQWERLREEREADAARSIERARVRAEQRAAATPPVVQEIYPGGGFGGVLPYAGFPYGPNVYGHPYYGARPRPHHGEGHADRSRRQDYVAEKRRRGFSPTPLPPFPSQR
ncbi:MAG: DUF4124 domain-containing protein [Gammaproteobacteria bacterium]